MNEDKLRAENEAQIEFYKGRNRWAFEEIQKILGEKEKGNLSIDLDIKQKIFSQVHSDSVKGLEFAEHIKDALNVNGERE